MTDINAIIALLVLTVVFLGMAREWSSPDILALSGASVLLAAGVLETDELLRVFSNSGPVTIAAMFIVSSALQNTGAIELFGVGLQRVADTSSPRLAALGLMIAVMVASAFINNTPVVVILTPIVIAMARNLREAPSRLLIPLSYASILGGTCTLIGTSTNLLVDGVASDHGLAPFGVFELTAPGAVMGVVGIVYLMVFGRRLLPERRSPADVLEDEGRKRFLTEFIITPSSDLIDTPLGKVGSGDTEVVEVIRNGEALPRRHELTLRLGDRVIVRTSAGEAVHLRDAAGPVAESKDDPQVRRRLLPAGFEVVGEAETLIREGIVRPGSQYEGRAVGSLNLRRLYDVRILAVHRQGGETRRDFERVRLQMGDTLLLEGPPEGLKRLFDTQELVSLGEPVLHRIQKEKAPIAVAAVVLLVLLAALGVMPLVALAMMAAVVMLATGCLKGGEAYQSVEWRILFLIYGMLAIGRALESSGAVELIVHTLFALAGDLHPWVVLAVLYLIASLFTELITNNAVAIVMTPIALGLAAQLGFDPRPFAVAIMFAGSASFATPLGYQTNTFVFGAGNYRFSDFVKVGAPLNIIMWIVATLLIPLFWPLTPA